MEQPQIVVGDLVTWKSDTSIDWSSAVWEVTEIRTVWNNRQVATLQHKRRAQRDYYSLDLLRPLREDERARV